MSFGESKIDILENCEHERICEEFFVTSMEKEQGYMVYSERFQLRRGERSRKADVSEVFGEVERTLRHAVG
ncbi:MAG: hypothetical protein FWG82_06310 [Oscillospiraceae bacterium]|nr:hypothetical protein [Oscillospiraceae bacterium]